MFGRNPARRLLGRLTILQSLSEPRNTTEVVELAIWPRNALKKEWRDRPEFPAVTVALGEPTMTPRPASIMSKGSVACRPRSRFGGSGRHTSWTTRLPCEQDLLGERSPLGNRVEVLEKAI